MKKTATLVAGLLLVTGTVLATGLNGWELTGTTVEGDLWLMHSENGPLTSEGGDLDITLKATKETEMGTFGVEVFMENDDDDDNEVSLSYSRTQGNFEVGMGATILKDPTGNTEDNDAKFDLTTKAGDSSYLKWNVSDKMSLTYYPWEVAGMSSFDEDTFEAFAIGDRTEDNDGDSFVEAKGGLALAINVNADTTATVKYAIVSGNEDNSENFFAYKGELKTKVGPASVDAYVAYTTGFATDYVDGDETKGIDDKAMYALGAIALMDLNEKVSLTVEFNMENIEDAKVGDKKAEDAMGLFVKGAMKLADMAEYKPTAYASFKYLNDVAANRYEEGHKGLEDYIELEAGLTLAQGNFSVTPKVVISMQDNTETSYFKEYDGDGKEDMAYKFGVNFKYAL